MTFVQDSKSSSTLTQDSRTAVGALTQDSKTKFTGKGTIMGAFLHPIFLKSALSSNIFTIDLRTL